jgi:hypothetical protein
MSRTDRVWNHVDEAFKSADKAFEEAERIFSELPHAIPRAETPVHQLNFNARCLSERWRLTRRFLGLGLTMLFKGKAQLSFKDRKR